MADENDAQDAASGEQANAAAAAGQAQGLALQPVQLALYAGWTMAVLYGSIPELPTLRTLPTVNELPPPERRKLERDRLRNLLTALLPDFAGSSRLARVPVGEKDGETRSLILQRLNLDILEALTAERPAIQLAYELGRSLRDTANPPDGANPPDAATAGLAHQLARQRVSKLQEWLVTLAPEFPQPTAAVVAASLGRWSDLAAVTVGANQRRQVRGWLHDLRRLPARWRRAPIAASMRAYLLQQGDVWLMLLIGELATSGLLTPEGYVSAGEAALRRSAAIVRGVLRHYWPGLLAFAAALGGTLFLAARYLEGAGKVWTSIGAIVGTLGISMQTVASTSSRLAAEAERPVFAMAKEDAMAWAITTMPPLTLTFRGVRHLRRAGIPATASLTRF